MRAHLKVVEVLELLVLLVMKLKQLLDEVSVVALDPFPVLLQVEDCAGLGLYFVHIQVVHPSDLVRSLRPLDRLLLFRLSHLLGLLCGPKSILDAELVVAALLLPELFQVFALSHFKRERSLLNSVSLGAELLEQVLFDPQRRDRDMAAMRVHPGVDELEFGELLLDHLLNLLPVNFKLLLRFDLGRVSHNDRVVEILLNQYNFAILIVLILLGLLHFVNGLLVAFFGLLLLALRERFVASAAHGFSFELELLGVYAGGEDVGDGPLVGLDVVAVEEVGERDVAVLGGLDLLAEELVLGQVLVREVVLNLGLNFGVGLHD